MSKDINENIYLNPIDAPHVLELIEERFDGAVDLLTPNAVIFGGAIRDILADKPIGGDLDIAVSKSEFKTLCNNFRKSVKWSEDREYPPIPIPVTKNTPSPSGFAYGGSIPSKKPMRVTRKPSLNDSKNVTEVVVFKSSAKTEVQIIGSTSDDTNPLEAAMALARKVDIACCGLIMNKDGAVSEVVKNALSDCADRILRIHNLESSTMEKLKERIERLVKRGWTSQIDLDSLKKQFAKAEEIKRKIEKARIKKERERMERLLKRAESNEKVLEPTDYYTGAMSMKKVKEGVAKYSKYIKRASYGNWSVTLSRSDYRAQLPIPVVVHEIVSDWIGKCGRNIQFEIIDQSPVTILASDPAAIIYLFDYVGFDYKTTKTSTAPNTVQAKVMPSGKKRLPKRSMSSKKARKLERAEKKMAQKTKSVNTEDDFGLYF